MLTRHVKLTNLISGKNTQIKLKKIEKENKMSRTSHLQSQISWILDVISYKGRKMQVSAKI